MTDLPTMCIVFGRSA